MPSLWTKQLAFYKRIRIQPTVLMYNNDDKHTKHKGSKGTERRVTKQNLEYFCLNESEPRRFPFELVYPLCFLEWNCTTSQESEYLYINNR